MRIIEIEKDAGAEWNRFVSAEYPPIGDFMHSWEWSVFQEALGRTVRRFFVREDEEFVAAFFAVEHRLPMGQFYVYVPRGPVIARKWATGEHLARVLKELHTWTREQFPRALFVRFEPPLSSEAMSAVAREGFSIPTHYVQPRYNLAISLTPSEEEIATGFHPSTRSNLHRAERRGVTVAMKLAVTSEDLGQFFKMMRDTIARNSGTNAYPSETYFHALFKSIPPLRDTFEAHRPKMGVFFGYQNGEPAAAHFVVFFGKTATYLYGASFTNKLSSKVTTYLHWEALREGKRRGCEWYDLGGIDAVRWPSLTEYKRQFRGKEFEYIGNLDVPVRPLFYRAYHALRTLRPRN